MRILIACDKFKFTFTSKEISKKIFNLLNQKYPHADISIIPVSDGGEGFLDIVRFKKPKVETIKIRTVDSLSKFIESEYIILDNYAFIESAKVIGLNLIPKHKRNPLKTTTFGLGALVLDAFRRNVQKVYLGLGGSSTNDGGIGLAQSLGVRFFNFKYQEIKAIPVNLSEIKYFDDSKLLIDLTRIEIIVLSDVKNKLLGKKGASHIFAKQKGASHEQIIFLEKGLANISKVVFDKHKEKYSERTGSAAAGGLAFGCAAFLNAKINSGSDFILKFLDFKKHIQFVDLIITGEGKFDKQTLDGKIVNKIIKISKKENKKIVVICGFSELNEKNIHIDKILSFYEKEQLITLSKIKSEKILKNIVINTDFTNV
jgi:glycerate kinase